MLFALLFIFQNLWAAENCDRAGLARFNTQALGGALARPDWCAVLDKEQPVEVREVIAQIEGLHQKAAEFLGITISDLHPPRGMELRLEYKTNGPLGSSSGMNTENIPQVTMGIVSGSKTLKVDPAVYLHEYGHTLRNDDKNPKLPLLYRELADSKVFVETSADLFALLIEGTNFTRDGQVPECFARKRMILDYQSYDFPAAYFMGTFAIQRERRCCKSLRSTLPPENPWFQHCKKIPEPRDAVITDRSPMDPEKIKLYSIHLIGLPINSFLLDLSKRSGLTLQQLVSPSMNAAEKQLYRSVYECKSQEKTEVFTRMSIGGWLQAMRDSFVNKALFDELYQKHVLSKGVLLDQKSLAENLERELQKKNPNPSAVFRCVSLK